MTVRSLVLVTSALVFALLVAGCGTTGSGMSVSYEASTNRTNYKSGTMRIGRISGLGYGSNTSILMVAQARCPGQNCTPDQAELSFLLQGSASDVALSDRSISLVADGTEYARQSTTDWRSREDIRMSQGRIASLTLSLSALSQIANASSLSGRLGNNDLRLSEQVKTELKQFVQAMRNPGANTASDAS